MVKTSDALSNKYGFVLPCSICIIGPLLNDTTYICFGYADGIYETDFFRCVLWNGIAKRAKEYCKKGDTVCIKGRLQVRDYLDEHEEKKYITEVIAESISFVSSIKNKEEIT